MTTQQGVPISSSSRQVLPTENRYEIIGQIAAGGMAQIYLARMLLPSGQTREVALKRLHPDLQSNPEFTQMFHDEARIAAQLRHAGIPGVYELGLLDGSLFMSMELVRGVTLKEIAQGQCRNKHPSFTLPQTVQIACEVLDVLSYAHGSTDLQGRPLHLVHRDISPQNILVTYDGTVRVLDFGIAKADSSVHHTRKGLVKGKFAYMSPEQMLGKSVDARSDLFSLGGVLYELLLQRHPFVGARNLSTIELFDVVTTGDPIRPTTIDASFPGALSFILLRSLQREAQARFDSAVQMRDALLQFVEHEFGPIDPAGLRSYMRKEFIDRLLLEDRARLHGDDSLLVESMSVDSRAEELLLTIEPEKPESAESSEPTAVERKSPPRMGGSVAALANALAIPDDSLSASGLILGTDDVISIEDADAHQRTDDLRSPFEGDVTSPNAEDFDERTLARIGRYNLLGGLGSGSLADTFLAVQHGQFSLGKHVVLKRVFPSITQNESLRTELLIRLRNVASLSHPNIVPILDLDADDKTLFVVTEHVSGWSLGRVLERCRHLNVDVPPPITLSLLGDISLGLSSAHLRTNLQGDALPLFHGHLTTDNVIVSTHGVARLTDLGLSPAPGVETDIRSVGAILYELITLGSLSQAPDTTSALALITAERKDSPALLQKDALEALSKIVGRAVSCTSSTRSMAVTTIHRDARLALRGRHRAASTAQVASWLSDLFHNSGS